MKDYLSHNRSYVLLFLVVIVVILLILWALFRDDDCKDGKCSDSYDSYSHETRYTHESRDSDRYSTDCYSESSDEYSK